MKMKKQTGVVLIVSFLTACGGYSAYQWAQESVYASEGLVRLDVANDTEVFRLQTDNNGVHAVKFNKSGELLQEQAFVTTWRRWQKILSANAGHYFLYSGPYSGVNEPLHLAYVNVES